MDCDIHVALAHEANPHLIVWHHGGEADFGFKDC